jgi:hypothetical protein
MQVINGQEKATINVSDLPQWEAQGFKPVKPAGKGKKPEAGKGKKPEAGKPAADNEAPEADPTEPEAGGEGDEKVK